MFRIFKVGEDESESSAHVDHEGEITVTVAHEDAAQDEIGQIALDILETERAVIIVAPIAGVASDGIDIALSRNILTLSGIRERPAVYEETKQTLVEECFFGPFSRSIILPENLALNKIRATIENNLLQVEIPKLQFPSKTIKIDKLEG